MVLPLLLGATIGSSLIGAIGAKKQADAQSKATRKADDTQRYIYDSNVALTAPARVAGDIARQQQMSMLGLGPAPAVGAAGNMNRLARTDDGFMLQRQIDGEWRDTGRTFDTFQDGNAHLDSFRQDWTDDPGYQFRLAEGQKAMDRAAAARGLSLSSGTLKGMADWNQGMASQEFGNVFNRLASIGTGGQTATGQQIGAGLNYANNVGQNALAAGQARASGYQGINNAVQGGIDGMFNIMGMANAGMFGDNPTLFGRPFGVSG